MRHPSLADALVLVLLVPPLLAALHGKSGPSAIGLKLGPGDGPYVSGFAPDWEILENTAAHWSGEKATIDLPLAVRGGPVTVSIRYSRPPAIEAPEARIFMAGVEIDSFPPRKKVSEKTVTLPSLSLTPLALRLEVDSTDGRGLGLRMEDLKIVTGSDSRVRLRGFPLLRPALLVLLLYVGARIAGGSELGAFLLALPLCFLASAGLLWDPWLVHRLATGLPEWLGVAGIGGALVGRMLVSRGHLEKKTLWLCWALAAGAFLFRAALFNHPDYYYSDLRIHAKLAEMVRSAGLDFFRAPAKYIVKHKAWSRVIDQETYAFPYTPGFHALFAPTSLGTDDLITAMKLGASLATVVPILTLMSLTRKWGGSAVGVSLLVFTPIYVHHLGLAYLAALFGHAVDMTFLCWLARRLDSIERPSVFGQAALLVSACQLAYVTSLIVLPIFLTLLAVVLAALEGKKSLFRAGLVLAFGAAGSILAVLVYYRSFAPLVMHAVSHAASGAQVAASDDAPKQEVLFVLWHFTRKYFDYLWSPLALVGLALLVRRGPGRAILLAWALTYLVLLVGRARLPFIFQHPHDALFVTPLVCLAAGEGVSFFGRGEGQKRRLLAIALYGVLALQGLYVQWDEWIQKLHTIL